MRRSRVPRSVHHPREHFIQHALVNRGRCVEVQINELRHLYLRLKPTGWMRPTWGPSTCVAQTANAAPILIRSAPRSCLRSAAAAGGAAAFADVAGAGGAHLGSAGHAEGGVDGRAVDLLQELGGGVG